MSEIKPIQYFKPEDFALLPPSIFNDYNKTFDYRACVAQSANEKLAPVLKMMNEMAEVIKQSQFHCVRVHEYGDETQTQKTMTSNIKALESYKSFLAQIEKEK